jgi:curved DNA-binding protein CbpA
MVKLYHPDQVEHLGKEFHDIAEEKIKEINMAYEELSNCNINESNINEGKNKNIRARERLYSFFSFVGIKYGDSINRAKEIFGNADEVRDNPKHSLVTQYYFQDRLSIGFDRETKIIAGIIILSLDIAPILESKGIYDSNVNYLGKNIKYILNDFGEPNDISSDFYTYKLYVPNGILSINKSKRNDCDGLIQFICPDFKDNKCTEIWCYWFI